MLGTPSESQWPGLATLPGETISGYGVVQYRNLLSNIAASQTTSPCSLHGRRISLKTACPLWTKQVWIWHRYVLNTIDTKLERSNGGMRQRMLTYNPPDRISAKHCMNHRYFSPPGRQLPTVRISNSPEDTLSEEEDDDEMEEEDEDSMDFSPAPIRNSRQRSIQRSPESPSSHLSSMPSPARSQSLMASPI